MIALTGRAQLNGVGPARRVRTCYGVVTVKGRRGVLVQRPPHGCGDARFSRETWPRKETIPSRGGSLRLLLTQSS
eukprot:scaffold71509_cov63-Phaeocystis_antarctica.AAC.2